MLVGFLASGSLAAARTPDVEARAKVSPGPASTGQIFEPAIAAGDAYAICLYYASGVGVQYAVYDFSTHQWEAEGDVDANVSSTNDPSIAFNSVTGEFVAAARTGCSLLTTRFVPDPNAPNGYGTFDGWTERASSCTQPAWDKPWLVAGEMTAQRQEFYIIVKEGFNDPYWYFRSIDGGVHWSADKIYLGTNPDNVPQTSTFGAQIAVLDGGAPYFTYYTDDSPPLIRILEGTDIDPADPNNYDPNDPADVGVRWAQVRGVVEAGDSPDGPILPAPLSIPVHAVTHGTYIPGNVAGKSVPQLALDPTNEDRMYLVYQDTVAASGDGSTDVDVFLHVLERNGAARWDASARIRVNNDPNEAESDQFIPSIAVDYAGYVNITFYDDRDFTQDDSASLGKFNLYFAWCPPDEVVFSYSPRNVERVANPAVTALDQTVYNVDPHEYNGIAWLGDDVVCTYTGTDPNAQTDPYKSVISSSRVVWTGTP
ncbi:MAG: hypothetical protein HRF50_13420 [Phycisphaerae bacterium]|jgi:hypothetical protein